MGSLQERIAAHANASANLLTQLKLDELREQVKKAKKLSTATSKPLKQKARQLLPAGSHISRPLALSHSSAFHRLSLLACGASRCRLRFLSRCFHGLNLSLAALGGYPAHIIRRSVAGRNLNSSQSSLTKY